MKNKIISIVLVVSILATLIIPANAKEPDAYYELEILDNPGCVLSFMVPSNQSMVYIDAEQVADIINSNGYDFIFNQTEEECAIVSRYFDYAVVYAFDKKTVTVYTSSFTLNYKAPGVAVFKSGVAWVPFEFTMKLFNIPYLLFENGIEISPPDLTGLMALSFLRKPNDFSFDFQEELGYSDFNFDSMRFNARLANTINGLLSKKQFFARWCDLLTLTSADMVDNIYATYISNLFTTPCESEVITDENNTANLVIKTIDNAGGMLNINGFVSSKFDVSDLIELYETMFETWPQFENSKEMVDEYLSLLKYSDNLKKFKFGIGTGMNVIKFVPYFIGAYYYMKNFEQKSETAANALRTYAGTANIVTAETMMDYADTVTDSDAAEILFNYLEENLTAIAVDSLNLEKLIGSPAVLMLLAWDFVSSSFPLIKDSLDSTNSFELSEHAVYYQDNAMKFMKSEMLKTYSQKNIDAGDLENLTAFAYSYLKFSIIARNCAAAAMNSSPGVSRESKKVIVEVLGEKNQMISEYLTALENGSSYMPEDVGKKRKDWNTDLIIALLEKFGEKSESLADRAANLFDKLFGIPEEDDYFITEEEAIQMVKEVMGRSYADLIFDGFLEGVYEFEIADDSYEVPNMDIEAYVIAILIYGEPDHYHLFVPHDGSAVWIGWENEDGTYFCYPDVDLYNFSATEMIEAMGELYLEAQYQS